MIKNDQTCVKKAAKRLKKGCKEAAKRLQKGCKKIFMLPWLGMSVSQTFQPSRFSRESPVFWFILPVSQFLSKSPSFWNNSKTNIKVLETHVDFSDTCGNGLINLSFVSKSKSFFNHGWQSVSFCNSLPQSSFRSPSSQLFYKRLLQGGGGQRQQSQYVGICPGENLPVFKLQRTECLLSVWARFPKTSINLTQG